MFEDLLDSGAYPHPVVEPIHHIQTHISHVFLTGGYAYKIKKDVDLGFLDYTTLEKRKHFCEREVELNRQFAPHLYIETVPVYKASGKHSLIPGGDIVEYAVKMHQFREEDVLLKVFERGELSGADVLELARQLAHVHAGAGTDDAVAAYGTPDAVRQMATDNMNIVRPFIGRTISAETFAAIESRTNNFFEQHQTLFQKRVKAGRIRECHGDLHLNNICRYEGRLQFFDRIEFNETYKNIDVIYDLAFLLMDIRFRGRADLATLLLNEYLEQTGDYEGALLLPVYLSMRAFIRGEVQSILASESGVDDAVREAAAEEAARYFEFALNALSPSDPRIILVGGVSGSGKSHLARQLAPALEAIHLRSDAVRKHLAGVPLYERHHDLYAKEMTEKTYAMLIDLGTRLAQQGRCVILDATWLDVSRRKRVLSTDVPSAIVFCTADKAELERRIASRGKDVSDADVSVMRDQLKRLEMPKPDEADVVLTLDTAQPGAFTEALRSLEE